jgi:hypothetical protein
MFFADIPKRKQWEDGWTQKHGSVSRTGTSPTIVLYKRIGDDLDLYSKAMTPKPGSVLNTGMSQRNLLTDLQRSVLALRKISTVWLGYNSVVVALQEVVARKLAQSYPAAHSYTDVLCLGWKVPIQTGGRDYIAWSARDAGDMHAKCKVMYLAIKGASDQLDPAVRDDGKILKVFMAPEFYFRGLSGAYPPQVVAEIIPYMRNLGTDAFADWLFVFGTAISANVDSVTMCTVCNSTNVKFVPDPAQAGKTKGVCQVNASHPLGERSYGAEIHNVALIQKGSETHLVAKEFISGVDFKLAGGRPFVWVGGPKTKSAKFVIPPAGSEQSRLSSKFDDERMGGCIFTFDGITIGLEVCLDHAKSKGQPAGTGRLARYADTIQLHLIPSAGMSIHTGLYCRPGGVVFNVDGQIPPRAEVVIKGDPSVKVPKSTGVTVGSVDAFGPFPIPRA